MEPDSLEPEVVEEAGVGGGGLSAPRGPLATTTE